MGYVSGGQPIEAGVKFRSDVSGQITGIRFYKGYGNSGTHTGSLWTSTGTLLATATFTNETASGWQALTFNAPVTIAANTTYVASYHSSSGGFALNSGYFQGRSVDNAPLHALQYGADGPNGVYLYSSGGQFPNYDGIGNNYWVDVVFGSGGSGISTPPPTSAPTIASFTAAPSTITSGQSATLTWSVSGATSITINGIGDVSTVTSTSIAPTQTTTYTLTATNSGGSTTATATITVNAGTPPSGGGTGSGTSIWPSTATPAMPYISGGQPIEAGLKFRSDVSGQITGIRFYKGYGNSGTHTGSLWTSTGTLLATGTFNNETASGWQALTFSAPVTIAANTTYVASYHSSLGGFALSSGYFQGRSVDNAPLHALQYGADGPNGVYLYTSGGQFPNYDGIGNNYWVDVVFSSGGSGSSTNPTAPSIASFTASPSTITSGQTANLTWSVSGATSVTISGIGDVSTVTSTSIAPTQTTTYTLTATNSGGSTTATATITVNGGTSPPGAGTGTSTSIWPDSATPAIGFISDTLAVEVGVKFRSDVSGQVTGIRFYKGRGAGGTHTGSLWTSTGTLLATGTFSNETASGWQVLTFTAPVAISANTVYVASYHSDLGQYALTSGYFMAQGVDNAPLHALEYGVAGPNGVYIYSSGGQFPSNDGYGNNYWVDVVFQQ